MALIKCSECGKEISDKANTCPNCGCPIDEIYEQKGKKKTNNKNVKNYSELTSKEKTAIRLYMRDKGNTTTAQIVLYVLGFACIILGMFFALWLFFFVVGCGLLIGGALVQIENEKKFYLKHPNCVKEKIDIVKQNSINSRKQIPLMIIGGLCFIVGIILATDSSGVIAFILMGVGLVCYGLSIYNMLKNNKK